MRDVEFYTESLNCLGRGIKALKRIDRKEERSTWSEAEAFAYYIRMEELTSPLYE